MGKSENKKETYGRNIWRGEDNFLLSIILLQTKYIIYGCNSSRVVLSPQVYFCVCCFQLLMAILQCTLYSIFSTVCNLSGCVPGFGLEIRAILLWVNNI